MMMMSTATTTDSSISALPLAQLPGDKTDVGEDITAQVSGFVPLEKTKSQPDLSIIIPIFNEFDSIAPLYEQLLKTLDSIKDTWELILIDDGSNDGSAALLKELSLKDNRVKLIKFVRNFGKTPAMCAGLDRARGQIIIFMDADLQNDPSDIPRLLQKLDEGFDVVSGRRKNRQDELFLRLIPSWFANRLIAKVTGVNLRDYGCCLKAFRSQYIQKARMYGEMHRFVPIYAAWQGARITEIDVIHHARRFGYSKYGISRTFRVILDLINVAFMSNFMTAPLYVFGAFGLASLCASIALFALTFALPFIRVGAALMTIIPILSVAFLIGGIQFILMGLSAEVLIRTYFESQGKRIYIAEDELSGHGADQQTIDCSV